MANEKFKFYGLNGSGESKLAVTESHPKLDATQDNLKHALAAATGMFGMTSDRVDLTSDTTVFTAE